MFDSDGSGSAAKVLFAKLTLGTALSASNIEAYFLQDSAAYSAGDISWQKDDVLLGSDTFLA